MSHEAIAILRIGYTPSFRYPPLKRPVFSTEGIRRVSKAPIPAIRGLHARYLLVGTANSCMPEPGIENIQTPDPRLAARSPIRCNVSTSMKYEVRQEKKVFVVLTFCLGGEIQATPPTRKKATEIPLFLRSINRADLAILHCR